jgi:hypothetical protein
MPSTLRLELGGNDHSAHDWNGGVLAVHRDLWTDDSGAGPGETFFSCLFDVFLGSGHALDIAYGRFGDRVVFWMGAKMPGRIVFDANTLAVTLKDGKKTATRF